MNSSGKSGKYIRFKTSKVWIFSQFSLPMAHWFHCSYNNENCSKSL